MEGAAIGWRIRHLVHLLLHIGGFVAILVFAELLLFEHNFRLDLTPGQKYTLSDHTRKILADLPRPVEVLVFTRAEDPRNEFVSDLLWRVNQERPDVTYRTIDVNRNPSLARRYGADAYGAAIVMSGGQRKQFSNLSEEVLAAALLQVTRTERKKVYFLTGHGEQDIFENDRHRGYSTIRSVLQNEFYDVETLSLVGRAVPDDATVLVVAGPEKDLLSEELLAIDAYLRRGGGVLVLVEPGGSGSLNAFLRSYRVDLPEEVAADSQYSMAAGELLTARVAGLSPDNLITATLKADPVFSYSRPVRAIESLGGAGDGEAIRFKWLLRMSDASWALPAPGGQAPSELRYQEGRDRKGPIQLGAEVVVPLEKTAEADAENSASGETVPRPVSRLIVYGDSDFANNFFVELLGNKDLFVNTVNWLAHEDSLIAVRPVRKQVGVEQFFVSNRQQNWAWWLGVVIQPSVLFGLGLLVLAWRRMR